VADEPGLGGERRNLWTDCDGDEGRLPQSREELSVTKGVTGCIAPTKELSALLPSCSTRMPLACLESKVNGDRGQLPTLRAMFARCWLGADRGNEHALVLSVVLLRGTAAVLWICSRREHDEGRRAKLAGALSAANSSNARSALQLSCTDGKPIIGNARTGPGPAATVAPPQLPGRIAEPIEGLGTARHLRAGSFVLGMQGEPIGLGVAEPDDSHEPCGLCEDQEGAMLGERVEAMPKGERRSSPSAFFSHGIKGPWPMQLVSICICIAPFWATPPCRTNCKI